MLYDPKWEKKIKVEPWQKLLLDAARYIEKHGWCQDEALLADGSVCMLGAIAFAQTRGGVTERNIAREHLTRYIGGEWIANWNDAPGRTQAQVLHALRGAAAES